MFDRLDQVKFTIVLMGPYKRPILQHFHTHCGAAAIHEVPQSTRLIILPQGLRLMDCGSYPSH